MPHPPFSFKENDMLGEVFEFINDCFPDQKLILKAGTLELGEKEIKEIEKKTHKDEETE